MSRGSQVLCEPAELKALHIFSWWDKKKKNIRYFIIAFNRFHNWGLDWFFTPKKKKMTKM